MDTHTPMRPYLVVPKLIEQPTWGGTYITETKRWQDKDLLKGKKIGQSYELYDKSNLSLLEHSDDPSFMGELADTKSVSVQTTLENTIALSALIAGNPEGVLGKRIVATYGFSMHLLLKFTQALGNSFQLHVPDGIKDTTWKPKPESWYYFEPGLMTCGIKKGVDWDVYRSMATELDGHLQEVAAKVKDGSVLHEDAKEMIAILVKRYNPWQYVNLVRVEKGTLLDLSPCGIHHSWEEDLETIPLGNVLYEIQLNVMDDVATLRSFDKGKMSEKGELRPLQIEEYFKYADRSEKANDPKTHMRSAKMVKKTSEYTHERILETTYYSMDRVTYLSEGVVFESAIDTFRHIFVREGSVSVTAGSTSVIATAGHSVFVPAGCSSYSVKAGVPKTEILISY